MEDIKQKKSLREIFPDATTHRSRAREEIETEHEEESTPPPTNYPPYRPTGSSGRPSSWSKIILWSVVVIIVGALAFLVSLLFAQATVKVTPKQGKILLQDTYEAQKNGADFSFQLMTVEESASTTVPASGTEKVEKKASGKIAIYNNFSTEPQQLVANTRFESKAGKIYRITTAVTVPGQTTKGGEVTPGTVEAEVVAEAAGDSYNLENGDFTIPGFKGSPRYDKFYARSKGTISGGFIGEMKVASAEERTKARTSLEDKLRSQVLTSARAMLPPDHILYDDAAIFTVSESPATGNPNSNEAVVVVKVKLQGIIFDRKQLSRYLGYKYIPDYQGEEILISNLDNLQFTLLNKDSLNLPEPEVVTFTLKGNAHVVWLFDEADLKSRLYAATDGKYEEIFKKYPAIDEARVVFRPPWVRVFPDNSDKIRVVTVLEESPE
jgi:hypothetical protein